MSIFRIAENTITIGPDELGLPTSTKTIDQVPAHIITLMMSVVGGLSIIFIIVGGLMIALSSGDPARYKQGRTTITYAVIGLIVSIVGYAVVVFVLDRVA